MLSLRLKWLHQAQFAGYAAHRSLLDPGQLARPIALDRVCTMRFWQSV